MTSNKETPAPSGSPTRLAVIAIVVEDSEQVPEMNRLLHEYGSCIIGRMGIPYRERGISLISVAVDAPGEVISALTGKLWKMLLSTEKKNIVHGIRTFFPVRQLSRWASILETSPR